MNIETFRSYCLSKKGVTEEFPFGKNTLVYKVMGKMFALTDLESFSSINLKVLPETGSELKEKYQAIMPAYHMNKKHWVTVLMDNTIPPDFIIELVDNSYELVVLGLTKTQKTALESR
jgi:predicted DNA-binding protein (MmcQ/YjbR family)